MIRTLNGHLDVVRFLVREGAGVRAFKDEALRWSAESGHREVHEYLKSVICG